MLYLQRQILDFDVDETRVLVLGQFEMFYYELDEDFNLNLKGTYKLPGSVLHLQFFFRNKDLVVY